MKKCERDGCENETENERYCSQQCVYQRGEQPQLRKQSSLRTCEFSGCSNTFNKKGGRFCSKTCANLHRHGAKDKTGKVIVKTCIVCAKEWVTRRGDKIRQRRTCSDECEFEARARAHREKVVSDETRQKLSEQSLGRKHTLESRVKIGRANAGSRNCHWVDGRSRHKQGAADYNFEFTDVLKTTIKKRDGYRCRACNGDGSQYKMGLHVHHIDLDKTNNSIDNLVTLCASCHTRCHAGTLGVTF